MSLWVLMLLILLRQDAHEQVFTWLVGATLTGYFLQKLFLFYTSATVLQFILLMGFAANAEATFDETGGGDRKSLSHMCIGIWAVHGSWHGRLPFLGGTSCPIAQCFPGLG